MPTPEPVALPGSDGEHELQEKCNTTPRAHAFYRHQVLDYLNPSMQAFVTKQEMMFAPSTFHACRRSMRKSIGEQMMCEPKAATISERKPLRGDSSEDTYQPNLQLALGTLSLTVCFAAWGLINAFAPFQKVSFDSTGRPPDADSDRSCLLG
jgi:hypothetical protein